MSKDNYQDLASKILANIGGKDNISSATHCMTRLRLTLKDVSLAKDSKIKALDGVVGINKVGNQYQIIIGPKVSKVFDALKPQLDSSIIGDVVDDPNAAKADANLNEKKIHSFKDVIDVIFDYLSGTLVPLIPILLAASLCKTIVAIVGPQMLNWLSAKSDFITLFTFVGDAGFYFFPMFIAWSAAKKLKTSIPISLLLGAILIHPTLIKMATSHHTAFTVYGIPTTAINYSSTVIPMLLTVWILSYVYKYIDKYTPDILKVFIVPFGSLIVMLPIMLCLLAPLGSYLGNWLAAGIMWLDKVAGPLAEAVVAGLFPLLVMTGMHVALLSLAIASFPVLGFDGLVMPAGILSAWAGLGVAIACFIKFKTAKNRELTSGYALTWLFGGVGEPLLYGLEIPYKTPLAANLIGGAIGGLVAGFLNLRVYVPGAANGIYGLGGFVGGPNSNYVALAISLVVCVLAGFLVMMFLPLKEQPADEN